MNPYYKLPTWSERIRRAAYHRTPFGPVMVITDEQRLEAMRARHRAPAHCQPPSYYSLDAPPYVEPADVPVIQSPDEKRAALLMAAGVPSSDL